MNSKVDEFLSKATRWQEEMTKLRQIALDCQLTENIKWGKPCYTYNDSNVIIIHGFKEYCALLFLKGALLADSEKILLQQTENVQAARQIRFTNLQDIVKLENAIKAYIFEAIEVEKAGLKVELKKTSEYNLPEEFQQKLEQMPELRTAFEALTPGRQRAYIFYFSQAKQSKTRETRIENYIPKILSGKGLDD